MAHGRLRLLFAAVIPWLHSASGHRHSVLCAGDCNNRVKRTRWLRESNAVDAAAVHRSVAIGGAGNGLERSAAGASPPAAGPRRKVAFLFLVGSELTQPDIWTAYFRSADSGLYSIYAHAGRSAAAKASVAEGLARAALVDPVPCHWCALFGVEVALLRAALRDEDVQQFVFVSHDAVPLTSFDRAYAELMRDPLESSFCTRPAQRRDGGRRCRFFNNWEDARTPKHEQWITLARAHAQFVVQHALPALTAYRKMALPHNEARQRDACSDEIAPLAAVLLGLTGKATLSALKDAGLSSTCRTFTHWSGCTPDDLDVESGRASHNVVAARLSSQHPATFKSVSVPYFQRLQRAGFLFGRKFERGSLSSSAGDVNAAGDRQEGVEKQGPPPPSGLPLSRVLPQLWTSLDAE